MENRKEGYYRVIIKGGFNAIALWNNKRWSLCGMIGEYKDGYFTWISDTSISAEPEKEGVFVKFEQYQVGDNKTLWSAQLCTPKIKGLLETSENSKEDALYELMLSLEVLIAYNNGIKLSDKRTKK